MKRSPADTEKSAKRITRRGLLLGAGQVAMAGVLVARMRYMQVDQADEYRMLAEENRVNIRLVPPVRGLIYDRKGVLLAGNEQNYSIIMVREDAGDPEEVLDRLGKLVWISPEDKAKALEEMSRRSPFVPVTIADRVSWEDISKVAVNAPALPGVTPEMGLSRIYPMGSDFAHVVGYVGPVSDYDLSRIEDPDPVLQIPRFQIGKTGVENKHEGQLRGEAGTRRIEVNAVGRVMRELGRQEGVAGANLQLTVNHALQNFAEARLSGESAAAVVMDPRNGDILAIASAPSYDPNKFVRGISSKDYNGLLEDPYRPLANKTAQGTYPPGSTFKMVTALAALEAGEIDLEETITCRGYTELHDRRFHCWRRGGHGRVNLVKSLRESCDVYYYELAQRVGIERMSAMARKLGLGIRPDVPLSGVAEGLIPTKEWKREVRGADWVVGDSLNAAIGQGFVLASPLQLAIMTSRIATGQVIEPRLVRSVDGVEEPVLGTEPLDVDPAHLAAVQQGMYEVVNGTRGTAGRSRVVAEGVRMAGKTGTSQVRNITAAERAAGVTRNEDLPWERRDHALFVSFAPHDAPEVAVSVVVEHGGGGSTAAAPIARDILLAALYDDIPPLDAYPSPQRGTIRSQFDMMELREPQAPSQGRSRA
ncbi:penicillin-binding protein 2 [Maritimibacter sp. UBA3975]|uniref:penicillin-binding protein 2 n=1 Tax=Maritimibacter sp. UBA3975 TaxID=1946833 RepID=UPI000C0BACB6|nr:penicillin-binding protein 2 [Maritimibacter sp. UBA3975]MAM60402.1 penicillin-binding protein 2 [Maritimibacter sp.]|tara:strand:- start:11055 stop:12998 length:1944 start_codon:yes stop_codon:yes gene_type:complete